MWQQEKKDNSIVSLALLLALVTTPMVATLVGSTPILAQSAVETPVFSLPQTVENGTTVRLDGSSSLAAINQSLKENFETQFSGTKVEIAANGTDAALKALLNGKVDVAAIGRGLTPAEKAQGLEQVRLRREKVAIIVDADNPFKQSLTSRQFARIFRGAITDWSELGGPAGKIRLIDHPTTSDTRENFRDYPAFKTAKFATGSNATQIADNNTAEIIKKLGKDGISYVLANQVSKLQGVRVLKLHQTLPDDAKYPFSQPLVYVYKKNPSPGVASFLGFTLAPPGQKAIEQARTAQAEAVAASLSATQATPAATTSPIIAQTPAAQATPNATTSAGEQPFVAPPAKNNPIVDKETPFWLLLPLLVTALGGLLLWWFLGRRSSPSGKTEDVPESTPSSPSPEAIPTVTPNTTLSAPRENQTQATANLAQEATNTASIPEGTNSNISNVSENPLNGGAVLIGGVALATGAGAAIWSESSGQETKNKAIYETITLNGSSENIPESGEVAWDIEAPAAVVNTSYPQLPNISEEASNIELPAAEVKDYREITASVPELPDLSELTSDLWDDDIEVTEDPTEAELEAESNWLENTTATEDAALAGGTGASILFNIYGKGSETQANPETLEDSTYTELDLSSGLVSHEEISSEVTASVPKLPELPEDALNVVADEAEPITDLPEEDVTQASATDFAGAAALAAGAGIGAWATNSALEEIPQSDTQIEAQTTVDNVAVEDDQSSIVLTPRTSQTADVSWQISDTKKAALRQQGGSQLVLLLYDVTQLDLSYQSPQLVQQYDCEETTHEGFVTIPVSDRDYITEIGYVTNDNCWLFIARSEIVRFFNPPHADTTVETPSLVNPTAVDLVDADEESSIVLTPQTSQMAEVSWQISDTKKAALRQQGGSQLVVRLYDVTQLDLSYQSPQLVQQYDCEQTTHDRLVTIPVSDRDYITEIGYVTDDNRWLFIARSEIVRFFNPPHADTTVETSSLVNPTAVDLVDADEEISIFLTPRTPKWAYVSWQISNQKKAALRQLGGSQLVVRLYDVTELDLSYESPQLIQQYECEEITHNRFVAIPVSDRDYMTEIGYITDDNRWLFIAHSAITRVFSRPQTDFWFVADTELIIHGATQPNTNVTIGSHTIKIKPDGTFHLRIPFSDGLIDYQITVATDGEPTRTIHKKFSQESSES